MKAFILVLFGLLSVYLVYQWSMIGLITIAPIAVLVWLFLSRYEARKEYRENIEYYQSVFEPIFVVGNHPDDDRRMVVVPHCDGLVVNVPHVIVRKTAQEIRNWLTVAENEHYKAKTMDVYERYFREGVFVNEGFRKGYVPRVIADFETARAKTHQQLHRNEDWYREFALNQEA